MEEKIHLLYQDLINLRNISMSENVDSAAYERLVLTAKFKNIPKNYRFCTSYIAYYRNLMYSPLKTLVQQK